MRAMRHLKNIENRIDDLQDLSVVVSDASPSWLGVETQEVHADKVKELKLPAERGVLVARVTPNSPAAKAGLKENDVTTEVNGQRVEGTAQFRRLIREIPAGRATQLTVWRDGRSQNISATLSKAEEGHRILMDRAPGRVFSPFPNRPFRVIP